MKILYTFLNFNSLTGSELYYYELAREMVNLGHQVTIASNCGGEITKRARAIGIECLQFSQVHFLNEYDIIHASHVPVVNGLLNSAFTCPLVVTSHSEILPLEMVPDNARISHFIGIRPDIYDSLPINKRSLIFNPIDTSRFNEKDTTDGGFIFFPGTINYLREKPLLDLVAAYGDHLQIVCMGGNDYKGVKIANVSYMEPRWNIEDVMKNVSFVAGIIKGRTYMEASFCGKRYIDYKVDKDGNIEDIIDYPPSTIIHFDSAPVIIDRKYFDSKVVSKEIESLYERLI